MRDKVIVGVSDQDTRHKLLACKKQTLEEVVNIARAEEAAKSSQNDLNSGTSVNGVKHMSTYKIRQKYTPTQATYNDTKCTKCGRASHANITDCPAINIVCLKCNERGHFAKWCKSKECGLKSIQAGLVQVQRCFSSDERINISVQSDSNICGQVKFRDDTGSDIDTIGVNEYHALGGSNEDLKPVHMPVFSADHSKLEVIGKVLVRISANNITAQSELYVIQGVQQPLLSKQSLKALGYLPKDWPNGINISPISVNITSTSPAQRVYGKSLKSFVSARMVAFNHQYKSGLAEAQHGASDRQLKATQYDNKGVKSLSQLGLGTHVDIQNPQTKLWDKVGTVVQKGERRDYLVKVGYKVCWLNRCFIRVRRTPCLMNGAGVRQLYPANKVCADIESPTSETLVALPSRIRKQYVSFNIKDTRGQTYN